MAAALLRAAGALPPGGAVSKGAPEMLVWVRCGDAAPLAVEVPFDATLADLRAQISLRQESAGGAISFSGRELGPEDDPAPLADLGISNESTVEMSLRPRFSWVQHHPEIEVTANGARATRIPEKNLNCIALGPKLQGTHSNWSLRLDNFAGLVGVAFPTDMPLNEHMGSAATRGATWVIQTYDDYASIQHPQAGEQPEGPSRINFQPRWDPANDILHISVDLETPRVTFSSSNGMDGERRVLCTYKHHIPHPVCPAIGLYRKGSWAEFVY
eukprot:TRINITY_DN11388_c0_g1_i1.p1 TRINITY_DN11388_c0_g1~~TRINITY_DN11388_c0_g1_i1.p1  ORF type:complete len:301 (+),score=65.15 TRINITY_DN11388_c0_g1_i1:92-904(+)